MHQIYRGTPMPKCNFGNFIEITLRYGYSPVNLLHIFRTHFPKNPSGWVPLILSGLSSCTIIEASKRKAKESIFRLRKLNERQKIFINIFMTFLKGGLKQNIIWHSLVNKSNYEWPLIEMRSEWLSESLKESQHYFFFWT